MWCTRFRTVGELVFDYYVYLQLCTTQLGD